MAAAFVRLAIGFGRGNGDFVPLLLTDPLQVIKVLRLMFGNSNLQLPPQIFNRIKVWMLARPLQGLNVLLLGPLFCCLGCGFWVILMLKFPSTTHFQCPDGKWPVHRPFDAAHLSCPLSIKTPPKHNVSISMFGSGDGDLGVIGSIPLDAKELDFGLI